jgi:hypothetical protein
VICLSLGEGQGGRFLKTGSAPSSSWLQQEVGGTAACDGALGVLHATVGGEGRCWSAGEPRLLWRWSVAGARFLLPGLFFGIWHPAN